MAKNKNKYNNNKGEVMPKEDLEKQPEQVEEQVDTPIAENEADIQEPEVIDENQETAFDVNAAEQEPEDGEEPQVDVPEEPIVEDKQLDTPEVKEMITDSDSSEEGSNNTESEEQTPPIEEETIEFSKKSIVDIVIYGEDELTIIRKLLTAANAKYKESNIITRLLEAIELYLVTPNSAFKGGALVQTYASEFNRATKGDLTNFAIFMLSKLTGKESEQRGLRSLSLSSIVNTTRTIEDKELKQESLKMVDIMAELHSAEERKKKVNVINNLNRAFVVNSRFFNANAVAIFREYFSK